MEFKRTTKFEKIFLLPEQLRHISSIEKINSALNRKDVLGLDIYMENNKIGFILLNEYALKEFFLWDYVIDFNFQNKGYGTLALKELFDYLLNNYGVKKITTTCKYDNNIAKHFYEKMGFEVFEIVNNEFIHEINLQKKF